MEKVKIITDSCSDLDSALLTRYDIDYAKMSTIINEKEYPALLTWSREEAHALYERIRIGERITTAQVSTREFYTIFEKYLSCGFDIVYIGCSSKQSGSVNTGRVVANELIKKYNDRKIFCIDSLNASLGIGMLAIEASKLAKAEKSASEIAEHITSIRNNVNQYVTVHTLEHLKKAGRVSASSAFLGNLFGVKPIIFSDSEGVQTPLKKVKGRENSLKEIVNLLKESIVEPQNQTIYIAHADCNEDEINFLSDTIKKEIPCREIYIGYIGPIIGSSIGPDAIGIWGFGNKIEAMAK